MPNDTAGPAGAAAAALELEEEAPVAVPLEDPEDPEDPESLVAEEPEEPEEGLDDVVVVTVALPGTVATRLMVDDSVEFGEELWTEASVVVVTIPVNSVVVEVGSGTVAVDVGTEDVVVLTAEGLELEHVWPPLMAEQKLDAAGRTCSAKGGSALDCPGVMLQMD